MKFWRKFRKLLRHSVVTGIPQIVASRQHSRRILKSCVFALCIAGFLYQTYYFLKVFRSFPTVVDVQSHYPDELELPALSVCSYNGIKSTVFCSRFPQLCSPHNDILAFCKNQPLTCDLNGSPTNVSLPTVLPNELPPISREDFRAMGASYKEIIKSCGVFTSPSFIKCRNYRSISVFDVMGLPNNCYTLNSLWGNTTKKPDMIKAKSILLVMVTSVKSDEDHFYSGTPFAIQLALHSPYSLINPFIDGFSINPCSNYNVYVSKLCSEECLLNQSVFSEGCVDSQYIMYPNDEKICNTRIDSDKFYEKCADACPAACKEEHIDFEVQELSHIKRKEDKKRRGNECLSFVVFRFNKMEVTMYRYLPKYESIELFGYIGGYLGIWLGISLIAVCDFIETIVLLLQCFWKNFIPRCCTKRKTRVNQHKQNGFRYNTGLHARIWKL